MLFSNKSELNNFTHCIHFFLGCEFFKTPVNEFNLFYTTLLIPQHKSYFNKFYRYKFWLEDYDCQDLIKMMTKKGKSIKYRQYLFQVLTKYVKFAEFRSPLYFKYTFLFTEIYFTHWLYNFKHLFNQPQFFKVQYNKIDKKVKKFTRQKNLTYKTQYNYIPPFKRRKWILKQYIFSIDYMPQRTYTTKLHELTTWWVNNPKTTFLTLNKKRVYWQILKNKYKSTLLNSY